MHCARRPVTAHVQALSPATGQEGRGASPLQTLGGLRLALRALRPPPLCCLITCLPYGHSGLSPVLEVPFTLPSQLLQRCPPCVPCRMPSLTSLRAVPDAITARRPCRVCGLRGALRTGTW